MFLGSIFEYLANSFGWAYLTCVSIFLITCIFFVVTSYGSIVLGSKHSPPEFSKISWFSMIFTSGMGMGLTFWSVAEPLIHFIEPPFVLTSIYEQKRLAFQLFFMHWGFSVWSIYAIMGVIFSYFKYNYQCSRISEIFSFSFKLSPLLCTLIDAFVVWAGLLGIVTTLGFGVLQISSGFCYLTGMVNVRALPITITLILTVCFIVSCISGVRRGIRYLSLVNMVLMLLVISFFLVLGPFKYMVETFFCAIIDYSSNALALFMPVSQYPAKWTCKWTIFHWATWISWSPIVGSFIARISRGRTIRELILSVILLPSLLSFIFVSIVGGSAFYFELSKTTSLCDVVVRDASSAWFKLLTCIPFTWLSTLVSCVLMMIFYITSADSGIFSLCQLIDDGKVREDYYKSPALIFSLLIAAMAITLIYIGGLAALRTASLFGSLPLLLITILLVLIFLKEVILKTSIQQFKKNL